jgi:hypothetical protein
MAANFCFNFEIPEKNSDILNNRQQTAQEQVEKLKKAKAEFLNPNQKELEVIFKENYETQNFENGTNGPSCRLLSGGARGGQGVANAPPQLFFAPPPILPPPHLKKMY